VSQVGVAYPDHPDNYGHRLQRELQLLPEDVWDAVPPPTDEDLDAIWEQERESRSREVQVVYAAHEHPCGHACVGACAAMGQLNYGNCLNCWLNEREYR
jgi:hypothetical protein